MAIDIPEPKTDTDAADACEEAIDDVGAVGSDTDEAAPECPGLDDQHDTDEQHDTDGGRGGSESRSGSWATGVARVRAASRCVIARMSAVLAVLLVAAVVIIGFLAYQAYGARGGHGDIASQQSREEVLDAASDYAIKLSSFDYRNLDKNRDAIAAMSTSEFAGKYSDMVNALAEIVTNGKGEATAEVPHRAIESMTTDTATVLLFVNQKAKNVVAPDGKNQPYRMVITMAHQDDRWLVDNVETV